jgi:hypothetical protein
MINDTAAMVLLLLLLNDIPFMQETADHLLYPNPASQMVSDEHLQYFDFFGKILGKVCFPCWIRLSVTLDRVEFLLDVISRCIKVSC